MFSSFGETQTNSLGGKTLYAIAFVITASVYFVPHLMPAFIGTGYIGLFLSLSLLSVIVWRTQILSPQSTLVLSILLCLCLAPLSPYTSNDSQRYLWDGAVFLSGFDPYLTSPNDPLVSHLREIWPTPEEHAQYPTLYPPGGLTLFALCAMGGPIYGLWIWKIMVTLAVISSLILIYKLLDSRNALNYFSLMGLSPLLLFETQVGAHLDIFSTLGITAALWCLEKDRIVSAAIIIGLAATTKFLPAVIVGPLLFYLNPRSALKLCLGSALTWCSVYGLMFGFGYKPLGLLPTFFEKWRGGAPIYPYLEMIKEVISLSGLQFLYLIFGLAVCGFGLSARLAKQGRIEIAIIVTLAVPLLLSPVLFPWYLLALIPFLALNPNLTLFTAVTLAPLSYVVLNKWLAQGVWDQPSWPSQVLLIGLIGAFILDMFRTNSRP